MVNKKVLIVLLFSNGDCLYGLPLVKQLKHNDPNCHITWVVAPFSKHFLVNNPYINELIEVDEVKKFDLKSFLTFKKKIEIQNQEGIWDEIIDIQPTWKNQVYYDGTIRSNIINSFPIPLTVGFQPELFFTEEEELKAKNFVEIHGLKDYKNVILFEFAPQSGQNAFINQNALIIAEKIAENHSTCIVMSSAQKLENPIKGVIDGSGLSIRETGCLMKYCSLLLGCSSGISWMATSNAGKNIPLIQLMNDKAYWFNPFSEDFKRFNITQPLIELYKYDIEKIVSCVKSAMLDFDKARLKYNETVEPQFHTTRRIIYNFLVYGQFSSIIKHIKINFYRYGWNWNLILNIIIAFVGAPIKFVRNRIQKLLNKRKYT